MEEAGRPGLLPSGHPQQRPGWWNPAPTRSSFPELERRARGAVLRRTRLSRSPRRLTDGQGSGRARPPHLHLRRPAGVTAARAQTQIPARPCLWEALTTAKVSGRGRHRGRGRGAGPDQGGKGLTPPFPGRSVREAVRGFREGPCLSSAAVVEWKKQNKTRFPGNEKTQPEPSAPALRDLRGEAVYPVSFPKSRPRLFPSPLVFSQDPRRILGSLGQTGSQAASPKSQILAVPPPTRPVFPLRPPSTPHVSSESFPFHNPRMTQCLISCSLKIRRKNSIDSASLNRLVPHLDPYHGFRPYSALILSQTGQVPECCLQTQ